MTTPRDRLPRGRPAGMPLVGPSGPSGQARARPPIPEPGPPYAEVERADRWTWTVRLYRRRGFTAYRYRRVWGSRERADRIAARMLRRYLAREAATAGTRHEVEP